MQFLLAQLPEPFFTNPRKHVHNVLREYSLTLGAGTILGLLLLNLAPHEYHYLTPHWLHVGVFEILFALFLGAAMKEIWEECFPGNRDKNQKDGVFYAKNTRLLVLVMTAGGILGPTSLFFGGMLFGFDISRDAFVVVTATDIAFSAVVAKKIFRETSHPAVQLLLGLAIADDLIGMLLIATFYGEGLFRMETLYGAGIVIAAMAIAFFVLRGALKRTWYVWYVIPGAISMLGLYIAGMHMALALVPIIPCMPHGKRDPLIFDEIERYHSSLGTEFKDTLNRAEHELQPLIGVTLFLFAFMASGVHLGGVGSITWYVAICLMVGKLYGIVVACEIARKIPGLWPQEVTRHMTVVIGMLAGAGFTVALFVAELAFTGDAQDAASIGAMLSLSSIGLAILYAWRSGVINEVREQLPVFPETAMSIGAYASSKERPLVAVESERPSKSRRTYKRVSGPRPSMSPTKSQLVYTAVIGLAFLAIASKARKDAAAVEESKS